MKNLLSRFRTSLFFLLRRDSSFIQLSLGANAILNAFLVTITYRGFSLAPFTESAIALFTWPPVWWVAVLIVMGVVKIALVGLSLSAEARGDEYRYLPITAHVSFAATLMWAILGSAVWTAGYPTVVGLRYGVPCVFSMIVYLSVTLRMREGRARRRKRDGELQQAKSSVISQKDVRIEDEVAQRQAEFRESCEMQCAPVR